MTFLLSYTVFLGRGEVGALSALSPLAAPVSVPLLPSLPLMPLPLVLAPSLSLRPRSATASSISSAGPRKLKGVASNPMNSDREKLRVASVARNMPSSSREKHCISSLCCDVMWGRSRRASSRGMKMLRLRKRRVGAM